ncbi:MAG TPA: sigma-54-dependent Fis family transcriptional regulator [Planctomycetota bacterium]|nr:sigma-54-dependent Fis family transcriptional regulator [Planctomycetota bacterium]
MTPGSERRASRLLDVARAVATDGDLPRVLGGILEAVLEFTGAERGYIAADGVTYAAPAGAPAPSRTVLDRAWAAPRPFVVADALEDGGFSSADSIRGRRVRSVCAVPLRDGTETLGVLCLDHSAAPGLFGGGDLDLLSGLGALAAVALRLARRVAVQERELERLKRGAPEIVARSRAMREAIDRARRAAAVPFPVHLHGESGTGKELIARLIHGGRGPFVAANAAAIPDALAESECFGHARGAFTGADRDRPGLFEQADGGTLFLDEVEAMSPSLQEKLLRVLQDGQVRRLGEGRMRSVSVRIVSASNADLRAGAAEGRFRPDLLYRLDVVRIDLPPLRERPEDIAPLADHFLERFARSAGRSRPRLSLGALEFLRHLPWPGNVRQLQNALWQAATMSRGPLLEPPDFGFLDAPAPPVQGPILPVDEYLRRVVLAHAGRLTFAEIARRLGVSRKLLWERRKSWGLVPSNP